MTEIENNNRELLLGMICHLITLSGLLIPFGNFLFPIIIYILYRRKSEYILYHAKESLNFQISFSVIGILFVVFTFAIAFDDLVIFTGALIGAFFGIFYLMQIVNAAMSAKRNELFKYPLTFRIIR